MHTDNKELIIIFLWQGQMVRLIVYCTTVVDRAYAVGKQFSKRLRGFSQQGAHGPPDPGERSDHPFFMEREPVRYVRLSLGSIAVTE